MATEVLFYHLERAPLEHVLPGLLEKSLARGWKAVVQASSDERIAELDMLLWTYNDASFLPHGTQNDGFPEDQPIFLTTEDSNPNDAAIRFLVDGASIADFTPYDRAVFIFDGHDQNAVSQARDHWKNAKDSNCDVTYWKQNGQGRWEKHG